MRSIFASGQEAVQGLSKGIRLAERRSCQRANLFASGFRASFLRAVLEQACSRAVNSGYIKYHKPTCYYIITMIQYHYIITMIQECFMSKITIYHGSQHVIQRPSLHIGKKHNDYGQGFYCTEDLELAKEWACKNEEDGFANIYELDTSDLRILNLNSEDYTILNWIAILLQNRVFSLGTPLSIKAREYIIEHFSLDIENYDVVIGYRADDSYFSFAEAFVSNSLSLTNLNKALRLGKLGEQVALVSDKAFENLEYIESVAAESSVYYPKFSSRDYTARKTYRDEILQKENVLEDIFVLDIIRQEMKNDDSRIQRIVSK